MAITIILVLISLTFGEDLDKKKEACMSVVSHLSKKEEFDIKSFLSKGKKVDKMKLMNYVLYDMFELCFENISQKHLEQALSQDFSHITPSKLGIDHKKYYSEDIPNIGFNFVAELLKFQTRKIDL